MRPPRIVNRGRIAPSSPKPVIDSGRNSWSSASIVSTIETQSPEPKLEELNEKLENLAPKSISTKKVLTGIGIAAGICAILFVIAFSVGYTQTSRGSPATITATSTVFTTDTTTLKNTTVYSSTTTTTVK